MAERIVTPEQQVENLRESIWQREYEMQHRGIPAREIMSLVDSAIRLYDLEQRVERGEVPPVTVHECDDQCQRDEHGWCPEFDA